MFLKLSKIPHFQALGERKVGWNSNLSMLFSGFFGQIMQEHNETFLPVEHRSWNGFSIFLFPPSPLVWKRFYPSTWRSKFYIYPITVAAFTFAYFWRLIFLFPPFSNVQKNFQKCPKNVPKMSKTFPQKYTKCPQQSQENF